MDSSSPSAKEGAFVGRDHEIDQGLAALEDVLAGRGRLLLLAGEPGIGKSRMADLLATRAKDRGVRVLWGRCWEAGGAPAFWPWVQSLRSLIRNLTAEELRAQMASGAADIAQLLPEVRTAVGDLGSPSSGIGARDNYSANYFDAANRLYEANGFVDGPVFGGYPASPHNRFMVREL